MQKVKEKKYDFMVSSDFEAYEKVMEAKNNYENGWKTYTIKEAYSKFLNHISKKNV